MQNLLLIDVVALVISFFFLSTASFDDDLYLQNKPAFAVVCWLFGRLLLAVCWGDLSGVCVCVCQLLLVSLNFFLSRNRCVAISLSKSKRFVPS